MKRMFFRKCPEAESIVQYFSGGLGRNEEAAFLGHVSKCPKCRLRLSALASLQAELEAKEKTLPDIVLSAREAGEFRKMAKEQERTYATGDGHFFSRIIRLGGIAAAGALLIFIGTRLFVKTSPAGSAIRGQRQVEIRLHQPKGKLKEAPKIFSWSKVQGADVYHLEIIDNQLNLVFSEGIAKTRINLPEDIRQTLKRQRPYLWTVSALDDNSSELGSTSGYFEIE